jgi:hypothetical protein
MLGITKDRPDGASSDASDATRRIQDFLSTTRQNCQRSSKISYQFASVHALSSVDFCCHGWCLMVEKLSNKTVATAAMWCRPYTPPYTLRGTGTASSLLATQRFTMQGMQDWSRLIKIDRDWSRLWSWYSTVCFASAVFSLALSGRETSTTPQKSWKARGLEGCPEIKSFPGRTHRNWFLLHIFWWIGMYFIYTRIILVSSFSFSVSLLFPPAFAEDRFLSSWCHSHKWFQMCSYPFASKQISLVLELIEELLLCHKVAHMLLLPTFLVRPGSAQLRSIRPSIHQTRSQKESWQTLWKISKNKTHFRCTQSQATFLSFSLFGTIWDD